MAAAPPTAAQAQLIASLAQDDIPIKLRCAICSKLAVNAFRLPCCEQAICETCQSTLPSSCPVCEHTPVAAEDCKPNKSLRTTIKVFLRTEEKKRESVRLRELKDTPPVISVAIAEVQPATVISKVELAVASTAAEIPETLAVSESEPTLNNEDGAEQDAVNGSGEILSLEPQQDVPQQSIEEIAPGQEQTEEERIVANQAQEVDNPATNDLTENSFIGQAMTQTPGFGMGFGFDPTAAGGFPNMAMMGQGGDFNQMQMMMAMQNGMAPNGFGAFPMMGMPGMSMDPMVMQNMFMNGGFGAQGMGMNGMNMGMGVTGYDGGVGTGFNNGWNAQQSWNIGQDNFNHPNAAGIGHGDYGANNSGFNQHAVGHNQGNYGHSNQYNDYQQNGYGNHSQGQGYYPRGRGRGRGYGAGQGRGQGYGHNGYKEPFIQQFPNGPNSMIDTGSIPTGPKADSASVAPAENVDEFGREIRETSESKGAAGELGDEQSSLPVVGTATVQTNEVPADGVNSQVQVAKEDLDHHHEKQSDAPRPIQTLEEIEASQHGYNGNYGFNGGYGSGTLQPPYNPIVNTPEFPINAPKGPKAMRDGLPNTSLVNLRGRGGFSIAGRPGSRPLSVAVESSVVPVKTGGQESEQARETGRERSKSHGRSRSRSRSRERERDIDKHRRRHRHRSTSLSEDSKEEERRRERRHRHSKNTEGEVDKANEAVQVEAVKGDEAHRSRSQSPTDSRRSSHRSRRGRDRDRDREREKDHDRDHKSSSQKHRSSHRSHRDSSRSREREHRHRRRHDSNERESKTDSKVPTPLSATFEKDKEIKIPSGPRAMSGTSARPNGIEIRGSARRNNSGIPASPISNSIPQQLTTRERGSDRSHHDSHTSSSSKRADIPVSASNSKNENADPHTLEREARNRERLLKEAQRIAGMSGLPVTGGSKRSRDDGDDLRKGRKNRRKSERFEDEGGDEERIARLESEREGGRWA